MSEEVYDYLSKLEGPSVQELQAIEDELGFLDMIEDILVESEVE